ncbi:cupin domain-containing protein [Streptomyces sp. SR27]|uniref:JmjC domain-containing protein n=1 Tax=Streptomyces sp. SR27 TaxID=3076630 RepID=UPI00295B16DB|nr:cupin domain-containing protein [Streptomyces sp. SR27]MDV9187863.1 cupin domain-containing protein [Streptomyces sp. SR27]
MTLAELLRPTDAAAFVDSVRSREPRLFPGVASSAPPLDMDGFEAMLGALHHAHEGVLHLARGGDRRPLPPTLVDADGMLDLRQVRRLFEDGETLYLTKAHRLSPALADLCRGIELDLAEHGVALRAPAGAHVFATPAAAQGFAPHRDDHGSLVVQLDGHKIWRVEEGNGPQQPCGVPAREWARIPQREFALEPGDVLYVPEYRGHAARTGTASSLHLTIRLFPLRWRDVLDEVVAGLPGLDAPVPHARTADADALAAGLADLLGSPGIRTALPGMLGGLSARRAARRTVLADGGLGERGGLEGIDEKTWLVRARGTDCRVSADDVSATIHFPGGAVRGPIGVLAAFEHVAGARVLRAVDLPGTLAPRAAVDVVRKLVSEGLLRRSRPGEIDGLVR